MKISSFAFFSIILAKSGYGFVGHERCLQHKTQSGSVLVKMAIPGFESPPWWEDGVDFKCTGCGKCCKVQGDVWLSKDELQTVQEYLGLTKETFAQTYLRDEMDGWGLLVEKEGPEGNPACVFLNEDNTCSIYDARPLQCSTYPFWPRLMRSKENWDAEAVLPEEWTHEKGGCEGINLGEGRVDGLEVKQKVEMQASYLRRFPLEALRLHQKKVATKTSTENNLIEVTSVSAENRMIEKTKSWVLNMVINLTLCPFAKEAYTADTVRYTVRNNTSPIEIYNLFLDEVELLFSKPESEISTTLIILPDAFQDFESFYSFSEFLEEDIENDDALAEKILIACFHPKHTFGGLADDDPIHYEKRSPYPTINILRASRVDEYINLGLTQRIGAQNEETLQREGFEKLSKKFENL